MNYSKIAFIFPGQGVQYVGMGKEIYEAYPSCRDYFDEICSFLEADLKKICFEGPKELLDRTDYSQPAIFAVSMLCLEALRESCGELDVAFAAGLSLGEYSALCFSGALSPLDTMKLVIIRGKLMNEAGEKHPGRMASILGLENDSVKSLCESFEDEDFVCVANINCPGQTVVSGTPSGIEKFCQKAKDIGAKITIPLSVSGAFHSRLMQEASNGFLGILERTNFTESRVPVISNVTCNAVGKNGDVRSLLARQLCEPVLWDAGVRKMISEGVDLFVEIGPGKVLKGLLKRIDSDKKVLNVDTLTDLHEAVKSLR